MDLRAVLFDINGTLIDIETDEGMEEVYRAIGHFLLYQGISMRRWEVRDLYFQIMKEQFAASTEKYPEFDVVKVWREILRRRNIGVALPLPEEKLDQLPLVIAELQRGVSRKRLKCFPGANEALDQLKQRYRLAAVTDAQTAYAVPEIRAAGLHQYFDPVVVSGDYGYRKPDVRLFQIALDKLQVTAGQAIFVGNDRYRDVFGARQAGMRSILFSSSGSTPPSASEAEADYNIYKLADLPQAVDFLAAR
jgi:putative hydrolase of the HAD superfamily